MAVSIVNHPLLGRDTFLGSRARRVRRSIRSVLSNVNERLIVVCARSGLLSSFYYAFFSRRFDREHQAVLLGRLAYLNSVKNGYTDRPSVALLRRNVHRLEKGLIMRPRRPVFALDYIEETVGIYARALAATQQPAPAPNEIIWAHDVLESYFQTCRSSARLAGYRAQFEALPKPESARAIDAFETGCGRRPYARGTNVPAATSYEDLLELCRRRRSIRWYQQRPVERDLIDKAIAVARLAPSACNRQPYDFLVFDDRARAAEMARLAGGTGGFADQIPVLIVVLGDLGSYFHERDRHLIYIDASLAAMSLMTAAETLGLSTCPINWSDAPEREEGFYRLMPSVPRHRRPIMFIGMGYADDTGMIPFSSRKELEWLRTFNTGAAVDGGAPPRLRD